MSISEYVKLRQSAVDEYEEETRVLLKIPSDSMATSPVSIMMLAAALESFGRGFDSAALKLDPTTPHQ